VRSQAVAGPTTAQPSRRFWLLALLAVLGVAYAVLATHYYVAYLDLRISSAIATSSPPSRPEAILLGGFWCAIELVPITLVLCLLGVRLQAAIAALVCYEAIMLGAWYHDSAAIWSLGFPLIPVVITAVIGLAVQLLVWALMRLIGRSR